MPIISQNLYCIVWHRNHIGIISSSPLIKSSSLYYYDFTSDSSNTFGGNVSIKEIDTGIWEMIAGDFDVDGEVTLSDLTLVWKFEAGKRGYLFSDSNMDTQTNNLDKNDYLIDNLGIMSMVPGLFGFACGEDLIDLRDGQIYNTVQIGTQCWMAENMNVGTMINGSSNPTDNGTIEKYCYNNEEDSCNMYGGLYQWDEMMQYSTTPGVQGICPTGWHLPTDTEWCILENEVDSGTVSCSAFGWRGTDAGGNLKETGTTHWSTPNTGATNLSNFTALGSGYRHTNGTFYNLNNVAKFWTSNENGISAWRRVMDNMLAKVGRHYNYKTNGNSVRCLQD